MKKLFLGTLSLFLTACHIPTHLQGGEGVAVISADEARACIYIGEISGFSVDEFKRSSEDEMKSSAMNNLRNAASIREANAVVITKEQSYRQSESASWRYNVGGTAYLCQ